jgi:phosphoribosyl 1,2-cyclic phosphate phosphodiesterase
MMKVTFLGTGTSTGNPQLLCDCRVCCSTDSKDQRLRSSILVETDDTTVLVDCGPDFRQQALRAGVSHIDGVVLTHEHYDHVGGLDDLRPFCAFADMPLFAYPRVINQLKAAMPYSFAVNPYPGVPVYDVHSVGEAHFTVGDVVVIPIKVLHHKLPVLGLRIGKLAYLTDFNAISAEEVSKLKGVNVLIVDALRDSPHISHNSLSQALALIEAVKPTTAWLIHMSHDMGLHEEVEDILPAGVHLSWDGLTLIL